MINLNRSIKSLGTINTSILSGFRIHHILTDTGQNLFDNDPPEIALKFKKWAIEQIKH